jgi:hypothetical protein
MKDLNRFFENVYKDSLLKLTEIEVSTMSSLIKKHMTTEKDALAYAKELGEKVAKNYDRTPLHPRTSVVLNAQFEFFCKNEESKDRNTLLAETYYKDVYIDFEEDKRPFIKKWFELFYTTLKANGIPFAPFTELEVA